MPADTGDDYIRRLASFVRLNERGLAEGLPVRRRHSHQPQPSAFSPFAWFGVDPASQSSPSRPIILSIDIQNLSYVLVRLEALGINVGSLDIKVDNPSRPGAYLNVFPTPDKSETMSLTSLRSSLSVLPGLTLGSAWWMRSEPPSVETELKYIYSSFTKLPALTISAPGRKVVADMINNPPQENALPLDAFKNLQSLTCLDLDPRTLLGWDRLAESLRSLKIQNSGLDNISDILVHAVLEDEARRHGGTSTRRRYQSAGYHQPASSGGDASSAPAQDVPNTDEAVQTEEDPNPTPLSALKWAFLKHLSLPGNSLALFPIESIPYLTSLTHLDLSSNLLVSVPPGLASMQNLVSLNLSDNMIDSVLGIYLNLGQVLHLNLARNRLESICGLERMMALERVDLRHNLIEECDEISRLAVLSNISEIWVEGNLFTQSDNYRVKCFNYFVKERKAVVLDGSAPTFLERRGLIDPPPVDATLSRSAPVAPIAQGQLISANGQSNDPSLAHGFPTSGLSASPEPGFLKSPNRKKKAKRIVDLDTDKNALHAASPGSPSPSGTRQPTDALTRLPRTSESNSRHQRPRSDYVYSATISAGQVGSMGLRSARRRARLSASVYEPESAVIKEEAENGEGDAGKVFDAAEAYRKRIEALKQDMGDGWLKVLSQSQLPPSR